MASLFQRLFHKGEAAAHHGSTQNNALESAEEVQQEYDEFCRTCYLKPGQRFISYLEANHIDTLLEWFQPTSPEPEPKSFIRLANDATRQGIEISKLTGLDMYLHARWSEGNGPNQTSREALALLAKTLGLTINFYFTLTEDDETQVLVFEP